MSCVGLKPTTSEMGFMSFAPVLVGCITECSISSVGIWLQWFLTASPRSGGSPARNRPGYRAKEQVYCNPNTLYVSTGALVMAGKKTFKSEALKYAYNRYIGENPEQVAAYEEELANAELARKIYDLRT